MVFLNCIKEEIKLALTRVTHWTLREKQKNKLTSIKGCTTQHSKALYVLLHHHQETSMSSTDNRYSSKWRKSCFYIFSCNFGTEVSNKDMEMVFLGKREERISGILMQDMSGT